jgi:hypothetical protein
MASGVALPPSSMAETPCLITITSPKAGEVVGEQGSVRGTAAIPRSSYLWSLAGMKKLTARGQWWPQAGMALAIDRRGGWEAFVRYGEPRDYGQAFDVALVVVDEETNLRLEQWVGRATQSGYYPPITFPPSIDDACPPSTITVKKGW